MRTAARLARVPGGKARFSAASVSAGIVPRQQATPGRICSDTGLAELTFGVKFGPDPAQIQPRVSCYLGH